MDNIHNTEPRTKNYMDVTETQENTRSHDSSSDGNVTFSPSEFTFDSGEAETILVRDYADRIRRAVS